MLIRCLCSACIVARIAVLIGWINKPPNFAPNLTVKYVYKINIIHMYV